MQGLAKQSINKMEQVKLPSEHQRGDYVVAIFPPDALLNCKVEAVKFKANGAVHYDLSVKMKLPNWNKYQYAKLTDVHWSFVCKQGEENNERTFDLAYENENCLPPSIVYQHKSDCAVHNEPAYPNGPFDCNDSQRKPTVKELQAIINKMDFYKNDVGFIAPVWGGELTFFEVEPAFSAKPITRADVLKMIDEA